MEMTEIIADIITRKESAGGLKQVYYAACGGSLGAFYPAKCFLEAEAGMLRTGWYNSNEFVHYPPKLLGRNSLVVVASQKGNTPETVKAAEMARAAGASVIALTWETDSPITKHADYVVKYTYGDGKDIAGEKTIMALLTAVEALAQTEGYENYNKFRGGVSKIDGIVKQAAASVAGRAEAFAGEYKDDTVIYTMGSGASWSSAYMQSICIFMEMQWINSACIHSGEYFHGPFEITDEKTPFVLQISEGKTRALDERALKFLRTYGKRFEVLDARELGLGAIDPSVVDYFNHSLFNNVYSVFNKALAEARNHPLSTRRYMWKVEY
ncbi:SIS domain-containing protein [Breznakiella homolactica]|uniref:SIS domain-containing protein n=1 Tax=Breznakiella homolactica TaxID=2798577 RepID=A0A7T7XQN5_9SPIR|nr:SIS domain-containing protein [Breznakiella homolactica]QQO10722.1 SIS domain-containing protein [Breznakiella homolactica]